MTNINCSENCIYQKDGKCSFESINHQKVTPDMDCAYFISKISPMTKGTTFKHK